MTVPKGVPKRGRPEKWIPRLVSVADRQASVEMLRRMKQLQLPSIRYCVTFSDLVVVLIEACCAAAKCSAAAA